MKSNKAQKTTTPQNPSLIPLHPLTQVSSFHSVIQSLHSASVSYFARDGT